VGDAGQKVSSRLYNVRVDLDGISCNSACEKPPNNMPASESDDKSRVPLRSKVR